MTGREGRTIYVVLAFFVATLLMVDTAQAKPAKRYKMSAGMALRISEEKAQFVYLTDESASTYGASNCERWNPYGVHCLAYVTYTDGKRCEWLVNVTNSRKNYIRAKEFPKTCRTAAPRAGKSEITAIYPKRVCHKTSLGKTREGGFLKSKPLLWGVVSFGWCTRRLPGKWQGAVTSFNGPLTSTGVTNWGRKNSWGYEGESKRLVKCVNKGPWGCSYLRVKVWHEFDQDITAWPFKQGHHTMKFSLRVGNGVEVWQ